MNDKILTALIAGSISIIISMISYFATRHKIKSEKNIHERDLERRLTEKLYDLRIKYYPLAFTITKGILGSELFNKKFTKTDADFVKNKLADWYSDDASFILSKKSLKTYFRLKDNLDETPEEVENYSQDQIKRIWEAKNSFRRQLVSDLQLLFKEDEKKIKA